MIQTISVRFSKTARKLFLFGLTTTLAFAQSGDISGSTSNFTTPDDRSVDD